MYTLSLSMLQNDHTFSLIVNHFSFHVELSKLLESDNKFRKIGLLDSSDFSRYDSELWRHIKFA